MKAVRFIFGLVLIPVCWAFTQTAIELTTRIQPDTSLLIPPSAWALGGGYLLWLAIYFLLPRPVRTYVLAHELTHALWGWLMGARVMKLNVSKSGGSVTLSKSNFWIALAPYFFPFYTVLTILIYYLLSLFFNLEPYHLTWLALVGFTWGFHLTFTITTLMQHQTDIQENGYLFSYALIYALNVLGICIWILLVSSVTFEMLMDSLWNTLSQTAIFLYHTGCSGIEMVKEQMQ